MYSARRLAPFALLLLFSSATHAQVRPVPNVPPPVAPGAAADPRQVEADADRACDNWGFEQGLTCWTNASPPGPTNYAFSKQPLTKDVVRAKRVMKQMEYASGGIGGDYWKDVPYPLGGVKRALDPRAWKSQKWIGTADTDLGEQGEPPQGEIRSKAFRIKTRHVSFLVGGGRRANAGVALQIPAYQLARHPGVTPGARTTDGWVEIAVAKGNDSEVMARHVWDVVSDLHVPESAIATGQLVARFSVFDYDSGPWGHVNADDFRFTAAPPPTYDVMENGVRVLRDVDHPVWGFADTHSHPANYLGFGGKTVTGDLDGPIDQALASSKCDAHNGVVPVMNAGLRARNTQHLAVAMTDPHLHDGYPTFIGWPTFKSYYHQQMYVDWIRRAYDGGQRLIVALGVTNMFWATRTLGVGMAPGAKIDDESTALDQLQKMKDVVAHNPWMEIATSPQEARKIIGRGHLAVVLGLELDNFGNFKDASYKWTDGGNYPIPPSARMVPLPADPEAARQMIRAKIESYKTASLVRQVTPLHYISGLFGGTAVFHGQFALQNEAFTGRPYLLKNAARQDGVAYNIGKDWSTVQAIVGSTPGNGGFAVCTEPNNEVVGVGPYAVTTCRESTVNAEGLTSRGQVLVQELMKAGILLDVEHASIESARAFASITGQFDYPVMSSHTDPRELAFTSTTGAPFVSAPAPVLTPVDLTNPFNVASLIANAAASPQFAQQNYAAFGTTQIGNLGHEGALGREGFELVKRSGGTVGVLTFAFRRKTFLPQRIPNDCDGSSKTFAQMYLYAVEKLGGVGVALSTDRGFNNFIAPRFGVNAAYRLEEEDVDALKKVRRTEERRAQANGVRYDVPFKFFHPSRFEFGNVDMDEEDAWKALAYWTAHHMSPLDARYNSLPAADQIPAGNEAAHAERIRSFVRGLGATSEGQLDACIACGDIPFEEAAMFLLKQNKTPDQLARETRVGIFRDRRGDVQRVYDRAAPVYHLWEKMSGSNEPLRKRVDGVRDWDINIDGMAHYGMLPDFLQDLHNVGLGANDLTPLFMSAEDYILMWERAESAAARARGGAFHPLRPVPSLPVPSPAVVKPPMPARPPSAGAIPKPTVH